MTINEIKKDLYKYNPTAELAVIDKEGMHYFTPLSDGTMCTFTIPHNDIQDAKFYFEMEAKHLNRWINKPECETDEEFIGMSMNDAEKYCIDNNIPYRLVEKDGQSYIGTCDLREDRLNFKTKDNLVISVGRG